MVLLSPGAFPSMVWEIGGAGDSSQEAVDEAALLWEIDLHECEFGCPTCPPREQALVCCIY